MTESRKVQLEAAVDATGAKTGFEQIKSGARDMAQGVAQSAQQAGKAVDGIGAGAAPAAQKVDAATKSLIGSIQRTTAAMEAGGRASSKYFEVLAAQRGVNADILRPYLAQLDAVTAKQAQATAGVAAGTTGLTALGNSAKATAAAMRQVPAQFQDIVVSLQAGQQPMTVLLQQGSQLATVFGGIGPAARALGTYVAGLVNPFTLGAAALGALAVAAHSGSQELRGFQNAVTLSGNAVGLSVSQFTQLRDSLADIAGTKGKAAEALTAIAATGQIASRNVAEVAEAAILMEKATGQAIDKTIAQFVKLADEPAKAAAELNKQYNFLTASIFAQIGALEASGQKQEAAQLATKALADTTKDRAQVVVQNVGYIEAAYTGVLNAIKKVVDATKDIGRDATLASVREQIAIIDAKRTPSILGGFTAISPSDQARRRALVAQREALEAETRLTERNAQVQAEYAKAQREGIDAATKAAQITEQHASKQQKLNQALKEYREQLDALRRTSPDAVGKDGRRLLDPAVIAATEAGIRDRFKESGSGAAGVGQNEVAAIQARVREQRQYLAQLQQQLATGSFGDDAKLTEGEKKVIELQEQLKTSISGTARAQKERALAEALVAAEVDKQVVAQERQNKAYQDAAAVVQKQADAASQQADAIRQQAEGQEAANASFGKSKAAIEAMTLAQMKATLAEVDATDRADPRYIAGLMEKIKWQEKYTAELQKAEFLQASRALDEGIRVAQEDAKTLELELSLVGQTREVREAIVGQRKAEVQLAKELAEIDKKSISADEKEELRAKARAKALIDSSNAAAKATVDEWNRAADQINQSLTDALLRGFESGKGFAENFRDTLKNMFSTLVLRPILSPITGSISGAMTGVGAPAVGGVGGAINGLSGLSGMASLFGVGGLSGSVLAGAGWLTGATSFTGALGAAGSLIGTGSAAGVLSGLGMGLGALGPIGLGVGLLASVFGGKKGKPKIESGAGLSDKFFTTKYGSLPGQVSGEVTRGDPTSALQTIASIEEMYKQFGGTEDLHLGLFTGQSNGGKSKTQLAIEASLNGRQIYDRGARLGGVENVAQGEDALKQALTAEAQRVVLTALKESNLTGSIGEYLKQLGDINKLSDGAVDESLRRAQTIQQQQKTLEAQLFDLTHTDLERLNATREQERKAIDDTNRALYDQVARLQDLQNAVGQSMAGLQAAVDAERAQISDSLNAVLQKLDADLKSSMSVVNASVDAERASAQASFSSTMRALQQQIEGITGSVSRLSDLSSSLHDAVSGFALDPDSGMQRAEARAQIEAAIAIAKARGVLPDAKDLSAPLQVLARPTQSLFSSFTDYVRARDKDAAAIKELSGLSDEGLSVQEQQLKALQDQAQAAQEALDATTTRLDGIIATAKEQVAAATGTTVAVMDSTQALQQLLQATSAYAASYGPTAQMLDAENARLDGILSAAQAQIAAATGTTVAVLSVRDAVAQLNSSLAAYTSAVSSARDTTAATPAAAPTPPPAAPLLANDSRLGTIAQQNFDASAYLTANPDVAAVVALGKTSAYAHYLQFGRNEYRPLGFRPPGFATGAAFENGIVSRPTMFNIGEMGEAGPEAIMPLANVGGRLGVRAIGGDNEATARELAEVRSLLADMHAALRAIAQTNLRTAKSAEELVDRGLTVRTDADTPLQVQTA